MATSPLHLAILSSIIPSIPRSLHLPNLQQGLLSSIKFANPLPLSHWRETLQVSPPRMRQGLQRPQQYEAS
jgi:hypothetical protein